MTGDHQLNGPEIGFGFGVVAIGSENFLLKKYL